uniref:hypothetical protein n=1 Tax=Paenibacillus taichungensis TaxID=484184 RepID=UPI0035E1EDFA
MIRSDSRPWKCGAADEGSARESNGSGGSGARTDTRLRAWQRPCTTDASEESEGTNRGRCCGSIQ